MFSEGISLLGGDTFDCGQRHGCSGSNHCAHRFGNFLLDFFLATDVDVPTNKLRCQADILATFADSQAELIFVDDHFHLAILDVRDANLIDFRRRQ